MEALGTLHRLLAAGDPFQWIVAVGRQLGNNGRHPIDPRVSLVAGADRHRHRSPQRTVGQRGWASRYSRSPPAQIAMTTSLTVPPVAALSRLMFSSEAVRLAKRRCGVVVLFH